MKLFAHIWVRNAFRAAGLGLVAIVGYNFLVWLGWLMENNHTAFLAVIVSVAITIISFDEWRQKHGRK